ncbi:MAG: hypothetical protein PHC52_12915 [Syntrophales bacterium]|nr:hypothetical protein [Syntrophales bacterium]
MDDVTNKLIWAGAFWLVGLLSGALAVTWGMRLSLYIARQVKQDFPEPHVVKDPVEVTE